MGGMRSVVSNKMDRIRQEPHRLGNVGEGTWDTSSKQPLLDGGVLSMHRRITNDTLKLIVIGINETVVGLLGKTLN